LRFPAVFCTLIRDSGGRVADVGQDGLANADEAALRPFSLGAALALVRRLIRPEAASRQYSQWAGTQRKALPATATWQTDGNDRCVDGSGTRYEQNAIRRCDVTGRERSRERPARSSEREHSSTHERSPGRMQTGVPPMAVGRKEQGRDESHAAERDRRGLGDANYRGQPESRLVV
jgi:hypothetical protein